MALLEKIRQRKKILAIVIGGALLAFIVEVAVEALGRQAGNSTAAKVGSEKIDIMAFQKRVEQEAAKDQNNQQPNVDQAMRQQQVLETMIGEKLLEKEYNEVGIYVSDSEITELMVGKNPAPAVVQMAQQVGAETPAQLYDFISNPKKYGAEEQQMAQLRGEWEKMKENLVEQYKLAKLQTLLMGGIQANDLDRAQMAEDEASINYIAFVKKDFASLSDDKYPVSDSEIKAEWEKTKAMYKLDEENRLIHFIAVNIMPSDADMAAADKFAAGAYEALKKGTGIDSVRVYGKVGIDTAKTTIDRVPASIKSFIQGAEVGATMKNTTVAKGSYKMYKLMAKTSSLDSIQVSFVGVPGNKKTQDSVLAMLNGGKTIDDVAKAVKGAQGQADQWIQVANYPDSLKTKLANAGGEYFAFISNEQGAQLIKVLEKKAPKTFYTYATISHEAYASTTTSDALRDKFQQFLNKNKTAADFAKNATAAGYHAAEVTVTPSTPQLGINPYYGGIKDSRKAIKWAFENKKGEVSPIFSDNNDILVAVCIDEIYDGDYIPYNAKGLKETLTEKVRNSKKGDDLMKQFDGKAKSIADYAKLMGATVDSTQVIFAADRTPKLENEPGLIGRVAVAKQGEVKGLFKGETGVYAYQVVKVEKSQRKATKQELDNRFSQSRGAGMIANPQAITAILGKATKIERNLIAFY